jgi:hypothetical protein
MTTPTYISSEATPGYTGLVEKPEFGVVAGSGLSAKDVRGKKFIRSKPLGIHWRFQTF